MAKNGVRGCKSVIKNSGTITKQFELRLDEPVYIPSVGSLERLGEVFGTFIWKCPSLWILLFIPVIM